MTYIVLSIEQNDTLDRQTQVYILTIKMTSFNWEEEYFLICFSSIIRSNYYLVSTFIAPFAVRNFSHSSIYWKQNNQYFQNGV